MGAYSHLTLAIDLQTSTIVQPFDGKIKRALNDGRIGELHNEVLRKMAQSRNDYPNYGI